jgi:predicted dithiol-disulfide oxidoreductase (DUF899 family)
MTQHKVGTREEWLAARNELLERENEHAQHSEELARQRQESCPGSRAYSRLAPDRDFVVPSYHQLLDRTPKGRVDRPGPDGPDRSSSMQMRCEASLYMKGANRDE